SAFISHDDLFAGRWRAALEATLAQPAPPERMEPTGAEVAADLVLHALDESRNRVWRRRCQASALRQVRATAGGTLRTARGASGWLPIRPVMQRRNEAACGSA